MKSLITCRNDRLIIAGVVLAVLLLCANALAAIPTIPGTEAGGTRTFNLTAKEGYITTPDGGSYLAWGYSDDDGINTMQYPGPTLEINENETVVINLKNDLCQPVSILFPGQTGVTAIGGMPGIMTREALPDGISIVTYTFEALEPGTYLYSSGSRPELQVEMGLFGAIIIRPTGFNPVTDKRAYASADSAYDREYLFLHSELDPTVHQLVEMKRISDIDNTIYNPVYWFLNGRCFPDTVLAAPSSVLLPHQPYNALARMHPGEIILMRLVGAGRDAHPLHPHSNNTLTIARDGRLLSSDGGTSGADLAINDYTLNVFPGATHDAIFEWTGEQLGWDIYGHAPGDPLQPFEYAPDHGKPIPVILPEQKDTTAGALYSGSPFLGSFAPLPPGGGLNLTGGYWQIWHSHHEKEVVNNDLFPGGQITFMLIDHWDVPIP